MTEEPTIPDGDDVPDRFSVDFEGLTLLGVYEVGEKLAEGGMGSVYLAEDTNLGRPVVVKVPHPRFLGEPGFRSRFAREVSDLVRLEHPHVARILARGEHEQMPFFVLQFLGGGSLEDRIAKAEDGRLPLGSILPWLLTIADTLDFVHERGIVHRDVKPGNILFDDGGHVFLSDFGVAKALETESVLTATGVGIGSPKYMAPEQGIGGDVGPASDQYSLASLVYEALSGALPFGEGNVVQILIRKGKEDAPDITTTVPTIPVAVAEAVMKALSRNPADRYGTCREFADALIVAAQDSGEAATATPAGGTLSLPSRTPTGTKTVPIQDVVALWRHGRLILASAVLAVVAGVLLFLVLGGDDPKEHQPAPEAPADPGAARVVLVEAGEEPRRALRYSVSAGDRTELLLTTKLEMDMRLSEPNPDLGELPDQNIPPWEMACDVEIESVSEGGVIDFSWEIVELQPLEHANPELGGVFDQFAGLKVAVSTSPTGIGSVRRITARDGGAVDDNPLMKAMTSGMGSGAHEMTVPLPSEPVGIGARWEVTRAVEQMGLRLIQTMMYELTAIEGSRAKIHVTVAQTATEQVMKLPGVPDSSEIRIVSMHSRGSGDTEVDLTGIVPLSVRLSMKISAELEVTTEEGSHGIVLEQKLDSRLDRR